MYMCRWLQVNYTYMYMCVWGELASNKRFSTDRPSSQGWASKCLALSVLVWCLHVYGSAPLLCSLLLCTIFLSFEAVLYLFWLVHVYVCVYVSSRQYLGVWGELASHKRSSTHRLSSQGWASKCVVLNVFVGMCLNVYMGLWASSFFCFYLAGVLYTCDFMYMYVQFLTQILFLSSQD